MFLGNLCRCTGYRAILQGYETFTEKWVNSVGNWSCGGCPGAMNGGCCMTRSNEPLPNGTVRNGHDDVLTNGVHSTTMGQYSQFIAFSFSNEPHEYHVITSDEKYGILGDEVLPNDPSQEPIFPPELQVESCSQS